MPSIIILLPKTGNTSKFWLTNYCTSNWIGKKKKRRKLFEVLLFVEYCNRWLCKILRKWPRPQVRAAPKAVLSYTQAFRRFLFCSWTCVVYVFHQQMPSFLPDSTPPCQYHSGSRGELAAGFALRWRRKIICGVGRGGWHCARLWSKDCRKQRRGHNFSIYSGVPKLIQHAGIEQNALLALVNVFLYVL